MTDENRKSILGRLAVALGLTEDTNQVQLAAYKTKDGQDINVNDADQTTDAPDGEYELEDGRILVVASGVVTEIKDAPVAAAEAPVVETPEEEKVEEDKLTNMQAAINALTARLDALEGKNSQLEKSNTELAQKLSAVQSLPADKKVVLNANQGEKSKAQLAFERAQARN